MIIIKFDMQVEKIPDCPNQRKTKFYRIGKKDAEIYRFLSLQSCGGEKSLPIILSRHFNVIRSLNQFQNTDLS